MRADRVECERREAIGVVTDKRYQAGFRRTAQIREQSCELFRASNAEMDERNSRFVLLWLHPT